MNWIDDSDSASGAEDEDASRVVRKGRRPEPEPTADDTRPRVQWGGEISRERAALGSVSWESLARGNLTAQRRFEGLSARRKEVHSSVQALQCYTLSP